MLYFVYDLETTGVRHWKNSVHQIAYQIRNRNGEIQLEREINCRPYHRALVEPEALDVSGRTEADLESFTPFKLAYETVIKDVEQFVDRFDRNDKMHLLGYNSRGFDNPFFRAFFKQNGDVYFGSWFWSDSIDVLPLASDYLKHKRHRMENFKLSTVAAFLGIDVDEEKLHDATYDLHLTWEIYKIVRHD